MTFNRKTNSIVLIVFFVISAVTAFMLGDNLGNGQQIGITRTYEQGFRVVLLSLSSVLYIMGGKTERCFAYAGATVYLLCLVMLELYGAIQIDRLVRQVVSIALLFCAFQLVQKVYSSKPTAIAPTIVITGYIGASVWIENGFSAGLVLLALVETASSFFLIVMLRRLYSGFPSAASGRKHLPPALAGIAISIGLFAYSVYTFEMQGYGEGRDTVFAIGREFSAAAVYLLLVSLALGYLLLALKREVGGALVLLSAGTLFLLLILTLLSPATFGVTGLYPFFSRAVIGIVAIAYAAVIPCIKAKESAGTPIR